MPGVSADLELTIDGALAAVDRIETALEQAASTFADDLATALSGLNPEPVAIDADVAEAEAALAALGEPVEIPVDADTSTAEADIAAIDAAPIVVPVEADTARAEAELGNLTQAAQGSADALGGVVGAGTAGATSLGGLGSAATATSGALGSMGATVPGLAAGTAVFASLAGAGDAFFTSAVNADASTQRFNRTLGSTAAEVRNVDVGNLNMGLADLNLLLGSSTSQTRNAVSSFAQLGQAAGASSDDVAKSSEELVALSARAVALNPALGSVGDVSEKLSTGLARGGRFAAQFGIALTSTEINARALADTGKKSASELTQYDKAAAGAALATEKYGDSLQQTITAGAESPIIALRRIGAEFAKFTTELGQPLIAPVFDLIKAGQPLLQGFATIAQRVLVALLPAVTALFQGLEPLVGILIDNLTPALELLSPILEGAGLAIGAVVTVVAQLLTWLKELPAPVRAIIAPFTVLGDISKALGLSTDKAASSLKNASGEAIKMADGADLLNAALTGTPEEFAKLQVSATGFAAAGVSDELRKTGVSMEDLRKQLLAGDTGFKQFTAAGVKAGTIKLTDTATGAELTAEKVAGLKGNLDGYIKSGQVVVTQGGMLTQTFSNEATVMQGLAKSQLDTTIATKGLSEAQIAQLPVLAQQAYGSQNAAAQLAVLNTGLANGTIQANAQTATLATNAAAWLALAEGVNNGTISEQNAAAVGQTLGLTQDQVTQAVNLTKQAVDEFVNAAVSKIPTAQTVFGELSSQGVTSLGMYTSKLQEATLGTQNFGANVETIGQRFPEVAAELARLGPEAGGALASSFLNATDAQKQALADTIKTNEDANRKYGETVRQFAESNIAAATDLATGMTEGFGKGLDFDGVTQTEVDGITKKLTDEGAIGPPKAAANAGGSSIGEDLSAGMAAGIYKGVPGVEQAARDAIRRAEEAARAEAQSHSPSQVFAGLGADLTAGVAVGMAESIPDVVAQAEAIVAAAAAAVQSAPPVTLAAALGSGTTSAATSAAQAAPVQNVFDVNIAVKFDGVPTEDQARTAGQGVADGMMAQVARKISVDARTI